ncbi:MAG: Crp/Fnr family transcriptional regulator [Hyphomicrobium sp.]
MTESSPFTFRFLEDFGVPLKRVRAGERLFAAGEPGDQMFLVLEGKVDVRVREATVEIVGLHGVVGEMALLDQAPRSASAVAQTPCEVAVIDRETFFDLVREEPSFALYVMRVMANRIRKMKTA